MQSGCSVPYQYSRPKRRMVDSQVQRSLNLLHINKCNRSNQVDDEIANQEEYIGPTGGNSVQVDRLLSDCVVNYSGHSDELLHQIDETTLIESTVLVGDDVDQLIADPQKESLDHLKRICRCCLSYRKNLQSLFDGNCISDMIMSIASIQLSPTDKMPSQICMTCVLSLSRALSFKQQLETADVTLRHYIEQGYLNGMKLVSLDGGDLDDEQSAIADTQPTVVEEYDSIEPDQTITMDTEIIINNSKDILLEPILSVPVTVQPEEDQLLQPLATQPTLAEVQSLVDDSVVTTNTYFTDSDLISVCGDSEQPDDDLNTLLQPLETHQLPRTETIDTDSNDSNDEDIEAEVDYIDEDMLMDDDFSTADPSKSELEMQPPPESVSTSTASSECGEVDDGLDDENEIGETNLRKITSWACFVCKKTFADLQKLQQHNKTHNREDKNNFLELDLKPAVDIPQFGCADCDMKFRVERDLRIHRSIHRSDGKFVCAECEKEVSTISQLKRHIRTHFEDKPHKCAVCQMGFSERGSLTRHFRKHTNDVREKKHKCSMCDKKYADSYSLLVHSRTHTGEKPWVCDDCGKAFTDSRLLNSHRKVHSTDKPFACTVCDSRFTHHSTLVTHIRTHTGEKPYVCSVCGKTFIQSSNLVLHMRVHSGEKPYKCSECNMRFMSSSTLTVHIRTHTGEKPYACQVCHKRFARQDITAHMRTHTKERPFACSTCPKRFATSSQLVYHVRTHTGNKPFACSVCDRAFSGRSFLKRHLLRHITGGPNNSPASKTLAPSQAMLNNPSTLQAIDELSRVPVENGVQNRSSVVNRINESNSEVPADQARTGRQIYRTVNPNIFRIEKVQSVERDE